MQQFKKYVSDEDWPKFEQEFKSYLRDFLIGDDHSDEMIIENVAACVSYIFFVPSYCLKDNSPFPNSGMAKIAYTYFLSLFFIPSRIANELKVSRSNVSIRMKSHKGFYSVDKEYVDKCGRVSETLHAIYPKKFPKHRPH